MERPPNRPCAYCEQGHPYDIGGSYDRQRCEATWLRGVIAETERRLAVAPCDMDEKYLRSLRSRLRQAEYVGD